MLRKIRIAFSISIFVLLTLFFLDFADILPKGFHALTSIQFIPALLALNIDVLAFLIILSLVFGRVYCSSICPLGIYQDIVSRLAKLLHKKKKFKYSIARNILRWSITVAVLFAFLFGFSFLLGLLDPYAAYGRIATHIFKPAYLAGNNLLENIFTHFNNYTFFRMPIYISSVVSLVIALITLLAVSVMAWIDGRIYCNTICPLGTVLGFLNRFSIFKIRINESKCNSCGLCATACKASCIDSKNQTIDYSRCVDCFNCIDACNKSAMQFTYAPKKKTKPTAKTVDSSKRRFLMALGTTATATTLMAGDKIALTESKKSLRKTPISPPGSVSFDYLADKCTSCHLCVSKCPAHIIKPSFVEYGIGGMMQPTISFENGFCNYDCTLCADVCPSHALVPMTTEQKHQDQMGQVQFIIENCIVYTDGTSCGACSEHCPTQAVSMQPYKNGLTIPRTDVSICVGCGGCEYICPAKPQKAIYVEGLSAHKKAEIAKDKVEKIEVNDFGF